VVGKLPELAHVTPSGRSGRGEKEGRYGVGMFSTAGRGRGKRGVERFYRADPTLALTAAGKGGKGGGEGGVSVSRRQVLIFTPRRGEEGKREDN